LSYMALRYEIIDTLGQYEELLEQDNREHYFRYTMMKPFEKMWELLNVPMRAKSEGGYDVLMATEMLGYLGLDEDAEILRGVNLLRSHEALEILERAVKACLDIGFKVNAEVIKIGLYLADREKSKLNEGYAGFGGIPGYITLNLCPDRFNISRLPALFAHEFHHNVRFSQVAWDHGNVTVGDYLVIEGLAESFAKELFGEDSLGPWVTGLDAEDLDYSLYVIGEALDVKGFAEVSAYMFGDEIAKAQGHQPVGLSHCAGYAVGYAVVQAFLRKSGKSIYEATFLDSGTIIEGCGLFKERSL